MALKAAETGSGPTVVVAIEQHFPEGTRLINDDVACQILPIGIRAWVWLTRPSWARDWISLLVSAELRLKNMLEIRSS